MITSLDDACRLLRAVPQLGFVSRPYMLLRTGCISVVLSSEQADVGWARHFDAVDRLVSSLPALVGDRRRGRELGFASYLAVQPKWVRALEGLGALPSPPRPRPSSAVLEDKTAMRPWLRALGLSTPADTVVSTLDYCGLRNRSGSRFVVQAPIGSTGAGTYLVADEQSLTRIPSGGPWLVSLRRRRLGQLPRRQPAAACRTGTRSGGDGADRRRPGQARLRGFFGADFVAAGDALIALELNCRLQGSTWLLCELELAQRQLPTQLRHILEPHGHPTAAKSVLDPQDAALLTIRHTGAPGKVVLAPRTGVYAVDGAGLRWRREGFGLLECGPDECVLLHLPRPGTLVGPGTPLARLVSRRALTTADGTALDSHGCRLVGALYTMFEVEPMVGAEWR
ncbi:hypothetical protein ACFWY9_32825 [Amycolatopsis sp. NPDC059027]|uniref:hypothetical protein n=1 Tax=Amycolatopsis sp. NPDC059027 TaxID=3346709 RepID=UPI003671D0D1